MFLAKAFKDLIQDAPKLQENTHLHHRVIAPFHEICSEFVRDNKNQGPEHQGSNDI